MMKIQSNEITLYTQKATARILTFAITFVVALVCLLAMPATQLFAADAPAEPTTCVSTDDAILPVDTLAVDININEPSCTITLATEDLVLVENPASPIVIDEPNMPQLILQLFMPLASR